MRKEGSASRDWLGGRVNDTTFLNSLSPTFYIRKSSPPVFIVHGTKDRTVPFQQSEILYQQLKKAGAVTVFKEVKDAGHALSNENKEELRRPLFEFLQQSGVK